MEAMMDNQINILAIPMSFMSGLLAWLLAILLQKLFVRCRAGQKITLGDQCGKTIEPIPTKLPWLYAVISVLVMAPVCFFFGFGIQVTYVVFILALFLAVSVVDIKYRLIPNSFVLGIIGVRVAWMIAPYLHGVTPEIWLNLRESAIGILLCFMIFFGGTLLTGGKVGMGDVKLSMAIGFVLGWRGALTAIALSGILMIPFMFTQPGMNVKDRFKQMVPFGPPFSLAAMLVLTADFTPLARYMQF